jgi:hypothetical protein
MSRRALIQEEREAKRLAEAGIEVPRPPSPNSVRVISISHFFDFVLYSFFLFFFDRF